MLTEDSMIKPVLMLSMVFLFFSFSYPVEIKSLEDRYTIARNEYDALKINNIITELSEPITYEGFLLKGKCYFSLSFIASLENNKSSCIDNATNAIICYDKADTFMKGSMELMYHKIKAYQLLADLDWHKGAKYGIKINELLNKMKARNHKSIFYEVINAIRLIKTPEYFGGNPAEGINLLAEYTDSQIENELPLYIAEGYINLKEYDKAETIINTYLCDNPSNLWADSLLKSIGD
jgi:hypothetical protein